MPAIGSKRVETIRTLRQSIPRNDLTPRQFDRFTRQGDRISAEKAVQLGERIPMAERATPEQLAERRRFYLQYIDLGYQLWALQSDATQYSELMSDLLDIQILWNRHLSGAEFDIRGRCTRVPPIHLEYLDELIQRLMKLIDAE
jgi:hypothetical protein